MASFSSWQRENEEENKENTVITKEKTVIVYSTCTISASDYIYMYFIFFAYAIQYYNMVNGKINLQIVYLFNIAKRLILLCNLAAIENFL